MEKLYSLEELTDILGVTIYTIRNYIKWGRLKAIKVGRAYRVKESDLNEFLSTDRVVTPGIIEALNLRFSEPEHEIEFRTWLEQHGGDDKELTALMYILTSNQKTREHINDIYDGVIHPECLNKAWQTGESKQVIRLAYNLYNGWIDRNNVKACSIPALLENDETGCKRDAIRIVLGE